jgi:Family of unknown function (DUF5677)
MKLEEHLMEKISQMVAKKATEEQLNEEQIHELIETAAKAMTTEGLEKASSVLAVTLREQIPEMIAQEHTLQEEFEWRLYDRWKKALDLYDAIVILTRECGEHYTKQHRDQSAKDKDNIFSVLVHIHVKACQTASAVGILLKSGYARDALARQRTLHEQAVTALFIKKHDQETAWPYWLHNTIESYKAALQYEQYCQRLGYEPHDPAALDKLRSERNALVTRFGAVYNEQYGWAAQALGKARGVSFADIEEDVGLDHLRPYYRMASHGIHANPKGLIFDIGNIDKEKSLYSRTMLAGASNAGLADPGQSALISLNQCTAALLTLKNDLETLMKLQVLDAFVGEACQAFIEAHRELMSEEEERIKALKAQENSSC